MYGIILVVLIDVKNDFEDSGALPECQYVFFNELQTRSGVLIDMLVMLTCGGVDRFFCLLTVSNKVGS